MLEIAKALPPLLVRVTVCALLAVPMVCALNDTEVGLAKAVEVVTAVPVSETVCGEVGAASLNCRVAVRVPAAVGVKVTETVQFAPAGKELPQVVVIGKSPGWAPAS